jgi:hypothetical protein
VNINLKFIQNLLGTHICIVQNEKNKLINNILQLTLFKCTPWDNNENLKMFKEGMYLEREFYMISIPRTE